MLKKIFLPVAALSLLVACNDKPGPESKKGDILIANMDTTVSPATDFFEYSTRSTKTVLQMNVRLV